MSWFPPGKEGPVSLGNLQQEMNGLMERLWHQGVCSGPFDGQQWAPAVDLYETPDTFIALVEVPGVDGDSIDLSYLGHTLTISGSKPDPAEKAEGKRAVRRERRYGAFSRSIELPADVDVARMTAKCDAGVLRITLPKSEGSVAKSIKIEMGDG